MADYTSKNRRYYDYEEESSCLRLVRYSGMPILYVLAVCSAIVGMICIGIITDYWANSPNPTCFLYSSTASGSNVYRFGSALSNCYWIVYGPLLPTLIALCCGIYYMIMVFGEPRSEEDEDNQIRHSMIITALMLFASLILLAVCCTLAEGMRVTCMNMGLNADNGKADTCVDQLDLRVDQYNFPVKSSTMIHASSGSLWTSMVCFFLLDVFHIASVYRRSY